MTEQGAAPDNGAAVERLEAQGPKGSRALARRAGRPIARLA